MHQTWGQHDQERGGEQTRHVGLVSGRRLCTTTNKTPPHLQFPVVVLDSVTPSWVRRTGMLCYSATCTTAEIAEHRPLDEGTARTLKAGMAVPAHTKVSVAASWWSSAVSRIVNTGETICCFLDHQDRTFWANTCHERCELRGRL